ncbi:hypothetical protein AGABI2DRAFT_115224 [Agaricus bisporus var. bisporus H97]|uniref:hypothetical protein n=1 Tax=Agaricus bisporus var. bisporus (strain H97 / ATCC MYA-4626 / FGSC 10389) TaxID=936046 RepID=UPI00029F6505|nr:hypothetical protein AGABI2DRAFT_115224 [Agaricus bisporus var. bisporus H97]EKV50167.1 hypothetical protein AGABI2DRAFT_115224 [Agaricus bisporus var. bisporus H97]
MPLGFSVGLDVSWYASNHAFGASKELTGFIAAGITLGVFASRENCNITDSHSRCNSTLVMLAFTWFCAVSLLIYFSVFMFAVCINKKRDATIWVSTMRKFPWSGTCVILAGSPITPSPPPLPVFQSGYQNAVPIIRAPKPKRALSHPNRREPIFSWRSGLSDEYQIEHFSPVNVEFGHSHIPNLPPAATAPIVRTSILPALGASAEDNFASSLYPSFLQPSIPIPSSEPARLRPVSNQPSMRAIPRSLPSLPQSNLPLSPPPLGDWPRPDIISRSTTKGKRKQAPVFQDDSSFVAAPSESRVRQERPGPGEGQPISHSSFAPVRPMSP